MASSTAWTSGTTSLPSTTIDVPRGARSATCRTARFSVRLILSPRNMASMPSRSPDSPGEAKQQPEGFVCDEILRVIEIDTCRLRGQPLATRRVVGEERAEGHLLNPLVVGLERHPCLARGQWQRLCHRYSFHFSGSGLTALRCSAGFIRRQAASRVDPSSPRRIGPRSGRPVGGWFWPAT